MKSCNLSKVSYDDDHSLSKENFVFICSNVATKIGILIKGFLKCQNSRKSIKSIIELNFLDSRKYYKIKPDKQDLIQQLAQLRLVKIINHKYFRISDALQNFAFETKK